MVEYEIKTDDRRLTLESFDAVVAAVRSGQIGRAAQIREKGEKDWTPVASVEALKGFFSTDIWSAWDEESDESLLDAFQKEEEPRAPVPLEASPTLIDEVEELPAASLEQVDVVESKPKDVTDAFDSPRKVLPAAADITPSQTTHPKQRRRPPAQVIDFPVPEELESIGAHALDLKRKRSPADRPPGRVPVRWGPIVVIGALASAAMLMWVWFVNVNADAEFAARPQVSAAKPSLGVPLAEEEIAAVSPYDALEDDLRAQLMEGILDITGETAFEDALLIELRRVRVDVRSVRVSILTWAGRNKDVPDEVSFNLKVMGREGELDRELGALGMVLGKYIQHYGLQVRDLNIILSTEEGLRKIQMNPETARRYFTHRVSLERFLSSAFAAE